MSLKANGLLVAVTITKPQLTAKDDKATGDAEAANNARGAGQYRKDLYPKHLIAPISEVESQVRAYVRSQTLPWGVGSRLLPAARYMDFVNRLSQLEIGFTQAVTVFMNNYTNVLAAAQAQQGGLFDPSLYPDTSELRSQFTFAPRFMPITDDGDFRVQTNEADLDRLKEQMRAQVEQDTQAMVAEASERLKTVVAALAGAMGKPTRATINPKTGGVDIRPPIFRDSIVENLKDVADTLEGFAGMLPPAMAPLLDATRLLGSSNPEVLRADDQMRASVKASAASLLAEIDMALGGKVAVPAPAPAPAEVIPMGITIPSPLAAIEAKLDDALGVQPAAPVLTPDWLKDLES